jgi:2OG-Fe(II) oxygenase superfamily
MFPNPANKWDGGTLATGPLRSWVQSHHLAPQMLTNYAQAFAASPARLIVLKNFLIEPVAQRLSTFLSAEAMYKSEYGLYSSEEAVTEERFTRADEVDRFFRMRKLTGTLPQFTMSRNALTYLRFRQTFKSGEFKGFFEAISGLQLGDSDDFGSHMMIEGDFLRPHSDDNKNRRFALVIYLSRDWQPQFGGVLYVFDPNGEPIEIAPEYNSLVAFDVLVNSQHWVSPIQRGPRLSIGGWYHKPTA